jgi:hypothetical protein
MIAAGKNAEKIFHHVNDLTQIKDSIINSFNETL